MMSMKSLLVALAVVAATSCMPMDEGLVLPNAASQAPAPPAPGLVDGCLESGRTVGRLLGRVYLLPVETRQLPDFGAMEPAGAVCLDQLDVSERSGYPSFPGLRNRYTWLGVDLQGAFVVAEAGTLDFRLCPTMARSSSSTAPS